MDARHSQGLCDQGLSLCKHIKFLHYNSSLLHVCEGRLIKLERIYVATCFLFVLSSQVFNLSNGTDCHS